MNKNLSVAAIVMFCLAVGFAAPAGSEVMGKGTPVITQAFASKEIKPGEAWKVYLNVSDPNGEMKNIFAVVYQAGVGEYPMSIIKVKEESRKQLSGYIYLPTSTSWYPMDYVNLTLRVEIQDRSGNFSAPAVFALSLSSRFSQEAPPQGVFQEQELGPVMVRLKTVDGGGGGGSEGGSSGH
jgi:hypothetical protein